MLTSNIDQDTNEEVLKAFDCENFVGRKTILDKIDVIFEGIQTSTGRSIINMYGIGGIGKTSILEYVKCKLNATGTPSASVDFKYNSFDIFDIIKSLYAALMDASVNSEDAFQEYSKVQRGMKNVEKKLLKQINKKRGEELRTLLEEPVSESLKSVGNSTGQVVAESIVPVATNAAVSGILASVGGVLGTLSVGIGLAISKIIEHRQQECITALNQVGLKQTDIDTFLQYKEKIINAFIIGVNLLAREDVAVILGFDTFEKIPTHISKWLSTEFVPKLSNRIVVFICGREKITNDMFWKDISNIINFIPVKPFSPKEVEKYLAKSNITDKTRIDLIIKLTGCLPWALALTVDIMGELGSIDAMDTYDLDEEKIGERVVDRLLDHIDDDNLKDAIFVCASANYFTFDILSAYFPSIENDKVVEIFKKVRDFSFTRTLENKKYAIHDVVSTFLLRQLKRYNKTKFKKQSEFFCDFYKLAMESSSDVSEKAKSQWEYIYHRLNVDENSSLSIIDNFFVDADSNIPLDIFEEYLYAGLKDYDFATSVGKLYCDFAKAQTHYITGNWEQSTELFKKLLIETVNMCPSAILECSSLTLAEIFLGQGKYSNAKQILEKLLENVKTLSLRKKKKISARLNEVYAILGQYSKGEKLALDSKAEAKAQNDCIGIAWACKSLGDIYRLWGKSQKSIAALKDGLEIFEEERDAFGEAVVRTQLARNYTHIGKWEEAEEELKKSDEIYERYGYKYGLANVLLFSGNILRLKHKWSEALHIYQDALDMHTLMQSEREISPLYGSMGLVHYHLGNKVQANDLLGKSIKLKTQQGYTRGVMISNMYVGDYHFNEKEWIAALSSYVLARSMIKRNAKPIYVCNELDLKIFLCRLAKEEFSVDQIDVEFTAVKNPLIAHDYNHLVAFLEYNFFVLQSKLSAQHTTEHIVECLEYAKKYNSFLQKYYYDKLKALISNRFSGTDKNKLEKAITNFK